MQNSTRGTITEEMRSWLIELVASYLELSPDVIQPDLPLSEYGLDSVYALAVSADIEDKLGITLDPTIMWDHQTVDALIGALSSLGLLTPEERAVTAPSGNPRSLTDEELAEEVRLPADVLPDPHALQPTGAPYGTVLMTGATGFAGAFILRELLDRSTAQVHVLVRARDAVDAVRRVRESLSGYGLWREGDDSRLVGVPGDLGLPGFGLSTSAYWDLAERVETIVHCGAAVNFVRSYAQLKPTNVLGTVEVLRLACRRRVKPVHFVSSIGVLTEQPGAHHLAEVPLPDDPGGVQGGYRQSKWVADRLVTLAGERGLPVCVYRPSNIMGGQDGGASPTSLFINALLAGCIQLGTAMDFDVDLLLVPVDFCAAAIAHTALSGTGHGTVFHLPGARPLPWHDVIDMLGECGYPVRRIPYREWHKQLKEARTSSPLAAYLPLFDEDAPSSELGTIGHKPRIATGNLDAVLAGSGIQCAPVDRKLLATYLGHLAHVGYLDPPATDREPVTS